MKGSHYSQPQSNLRSHRYVDSIPVVLYKWYIHTGQIQFLNPPTRSAVGGDYRHALLPSICQSVIHLKGQSTHARVRAITNLCIDGLPYNLVHMLS